MSYKPVSTDENKDKYTFMYEGVDLNEFPQRLEKFFQTEGYKLESGNKEEGVYGTGNGVMRILFGAFVKRYTFKHRLSGTGSTLRFEFAPNMTGVSGGVVGYNKMKKEYARMADKIKAGTI
ncbi:MAG TPA: hypothetical protein VM187_18300 [Niastella sp.]|nr:hypothetical protein [Niastella sp.]